MSFRHFHDEDLPRKDPAYSGRSRVELLCSAAYGSISCFRDSIAERFVCDIFGKCYFSLFLFKTDVGGCYSVNGFERFFDMHAAMVAHHSVNFDNLLHSVCLQTAFLICTRKIFGKFHWCMSADCTVSAGTEQVQSERICDDAEA